MRVRLLTALAGPSGSWATGDVYECDEGTARRLIAAGYAVPESIGSVPVVMETAEASGAPERAMWPRGKRKP